MPSVHERSTAGDPLRRQASLPLDFGVGHDALDDAHAVRAARVEHGALQKDLQHGAGSERAHQGTQLGV